jgi:hypothetical protein
MEQAPNFTSTTHRPYTPTAKVDTLDVHS